LHFPEHNGEMVIPSQLVSPGRHMLDQIEATSIVSLLYQTVLGREPDSDGLEQYVKGLVSGRQT
jgi:hypothetical protein